MTASCQTDTHRDVDGRLLACSGSGPMIACRRCLLLIILGFAGSVGSTAVAFAQTPDCAPTVLQRTLVIPSSALTDFGSVQKLACATFARTGMGADDR